VCGEQSHPCSWHGVVTGGLMLICIVIFSYWLEFLDFYSGMNEVSVLLGCDVA
jgi:hypothetical protein